MGTVHQSPADSSHALGTGAYPEEVYTGSTVCTGHRVNCGKSEHRVARLAGFSSVDVLRSCAQVMC